MEGLTFSASSKGGTPELRTVNPPSPVASATSETNAQHQSAQGENRPVAEVPHIESKDSPFQARLNYDQEKATLFVEILDLATGDVIQRIPAETAAERIHELTGGYGGSVIDKLA